MSKKYQFVVTCIFALIVGWLLYDRLAEFKWEELQRGLELVSPSVILLGMGMALIDYGILASFDYLGFRTSKLNFMKYPRVLWSAFICYVFTLNFGALVGGLGFRYRIYSRWKVSKSKIPFIIFFSILSNWSGYIFLLGITLILRPSVLTKNFYLPDWVMTLGGSLALLATFIYLLLCQRRFKTTIKGQTYQLPGLSLGFLQLGLSTLQWSIVSGILYVFMRELEVSMGYLDILVALLIVSIAGVITHIPAGLGVLETVFLKMGPSEQVTRILVALLCYRAVYYLFPLMLGLPLYLGLELHLKKRIHSTGH